MKAMKAKAMKAKSMKKANDEEAPFLQGFNALRV